MGMITSEQMRTFLRKHYKRSRFEGRDCAAWGSYSDALVAGRLRDLAAYGSDLISHHEAENGRAVKYTAADVLAGV